MRQYSELSRIERYELNLAIGMGIAFICYFIAIYVGQIETEVIRDRFWKNADPLVHGEIPIMEYPPFALVLFAIPRLFASSPWGYNALYVVMVYVAVIAGMIYVRRIAEMYDVSQVKAMVTYCVLTVMFLQFVADRYDIFPMVMSLAQIYHCIKGNHAWAFIMLALAAMTKLYPLILLPILLIPFITDRDWKGLFRNAFVFIVTIGAIAAVCFAINPDLILGFLKYHMDRPLEVGCVAATLIYPFQMLGLTNVWILPATDPGSYGSDDLMGAWPDAAAGILTPIMAVAVIGFILYYWYVRYRRERTDEKFTLMLGAVVVSLLAFMILGKVFSSQYIIWIIPFLALLIVVTDDSVFSKRLLYLVLASFILTQVNFAYIYGYLGGGTAINDPAMISMLVRNLMVVGVLVLVFLEMVRIRRKGRSGDDMDVTYGF